MNSHRLIVLIIIVFGLLAYANSFHGSFHFDDIPPIVENPRIQSLENLPRLFAESRGLVMATFALNYAVGELNVFGYHVVNTALHLINAVLIYFILFYTLAGREDDDWWVQRIATFSAFIFVVHPLHTQAVSYIVQRMEIMASTFYLLAILLFIFGGRSSESWKRTMLFLAVVGAYLLGLKSKEIIVTLPAALLLYDFFFLARKKFRNVLGRWPLHLVMGSVCVWFLVKTMARFGGPARAEVLAEQGRTATVGLAVQSVSPWEYFLTQTNVLIHYISLIIFPARQNLDYDFPVARSLFQTPIPKEGTVLNFLLLPPVFALLLLCCLVLCAIVLARKADCGAWVVSFCLLMFFLVLSPTSSFIPVIDYINDHRAYLASVFIITPLVMALDWSAGHLARVCFGKNTSAGPAETESTQSHYPGERDI